MTEQLTARERTHHWQDPAAVAAELVGRDGLTVLRGWIDGTIPGPPLVETIGLRLVEADAGRVVFEFTPAEFHYNALGGVHGGIYATVLDSAAGCAVHSMLPAGVGYTSLDLTTKFLGRITLDTGPMRCTGTVLHLGGRTALAQAELRDAAGRQYAHATSSALILRG